MRTGYKLLIVLLLFAFFFRLYNITSPIADWHSWRQADTAAVTRNFLKNGYTPLYPRYDDVSNIQTGYDNLEGYRFVEFPAYNSLVYAFAKPLDFLGVPIEVWHRVVSILLSLGSLYLLYRIGTRFANERVGLFAALGFAVLPYSIYYSRTTLPETSLVFFILLSIILFDTAYSKKHTSYWKLALSAIAGGIALLIKPVAIFFLLPIAYIWYSRQRVSKKTLSVGLSFFALILIPLLLWRNWIAQFPEGIPAWQWLLNKVPLELSSSDPAGNIGKLIKFTVGYDDQGIRYRPAFFRWLMWERLTKLILGYAGMILLGFGVAALVKKYIKEWMFFVLVVVACVSYVVIFAQGNVQHDYYQIPLIPWICLFVALGADFFLSLLGKKHKTIGYILLSAILITSVWFSWQQVRSYYWVNNMTIVEAGRKADELLPNDAMVIAPYFGDTAFLYQTNRKGWPIGFEIEDKIKLGATHYVTVDPQDPEVVDLQERYSTMYETDTYVILQLQ